MRNSRIITTQSTHIWSGSRDLKEKNKYLTHAVIWVYLKENSASKVQMSA